MLGFKDNAERLGAPGVSEGCTTNLNQDLTINALVCQHDIEAIYSAYGLRGELPSDFWNQKILTGLQLDPTSATLHANETVTVTAIALVYDRSGAVAGGGGGGNLAPPTVDPSLNGVSLTWSSDAVNVASISATSGNPVTIRGLSSPAGGSTIVRAGVSGGLPANVQQGAIFGNMGTEVAVTVVGTGTPPPGSGPFKATGITGVPVPITAAGTYPIWASVESPPAGTLAMAFNISYSNGVIAPIFTGWSASPYQLVVPAGSYNLQIEAIPAVGGQTGVGFVANIPVCTGGGGGGELVAPRREITPDAKEGC